MKIQFYFELTHKQLRILDSFCLILILLCIKAFQKLNKVLKYNLGNINKHELD